MTVQARAVPDDSLFRSHRVGPHPDRWVGQGDCFAITVDRPVELGEFVQAFYTSRVFRLERLVLRVLAGAASSDADARSVAHGTGASFAIWRVGERTSSQLLMCDRYERTRSCFQVVPLPGDRTELRFGSAVALRRDRRTGSATIGRGFRWLMGLHVVYSRILLTAAVNRLRRPTP